MKKYLLVLTVNIQDILNSFRRNKVYLVAHSFLVAIEQVQALLFLYLQILANDFYASYNK